MSPDERMRRQSRGSGSRHQRFKQLQGLDTRRRQTIAAAAPTHDRSRSRCRSQARPSHSRSEVLSLTRSDHGALPQRPESRFDGKITCIAAYLPHDRCTRPVKADTTGSTLRVILRLDSCTLGYNEQEHTLCLPYCRSFWLSSSVAAPEIVPVNCPVLVKSTAPLESLNNTGDVAPVNVSVPDASLKRPVPPVI